MAEARFIQIVGAIQLLLAAWSLLSSVTAGTQPLITCECCGTIRLVGQIMPRTMQQRHPAAAGRLAAAVTPGTQPIITTCALQKPRQFPYFWSRLMLQLQGVQTMLQMGSLQGGPVCR